MSYSTDLKERVLSFIEEGGSKTKASQLFKVGLWSIFRWINKKKETGTLNDKIRESSPRKLTLEALSEYVKSHPDHYLREIGAVFQVTPSAVFYAL